MPISINHTLNIILLDDHPHFLRYAIDLANVLRNVIFVDQAWLVLQLFRESYNLGSGCLSRFKEARSTATFRGTYHRKYCQGKLYSLRLSHS
jgi:hypothetical protein